MPSLVLELLLVVISLVEQLVSNVSLAGFDDISSILTVDYKILLKTMSTVKGRNCKARIGTCMQCFESGRLSNCSSSS
jgi:hypothetical protein